MFKTWHTFHWRRRRRTRIYHFWQFVYFFTIFDHVWPFLTNFDQVNGRVLTAPRWGQKCDGGGVEIVGGIPFSDHFCHVWTFLPYSHLLLFLNIFYHVWPFLTMFDYYDHFWQFWHFSPELLAGYSLHLGGVKAWRRRSSSGKRNTVV